MFKKRIFNELYYIINKKETTAKELSEKFEVSTRTIYRDIDTLSTSGIPIYTETGRTGGIRLMGNFLLQNDLLTSGEQEDIIVALQAAQLSDNFDNEDLLLKLNALFNTSIIDWIDIEISSWSNDFLSKNHFEAIKNAILNHQVINFEYIKGTKLDIRKVEPYKLICRNYNWYVQGYCLKKQQFRLFKLSKMLNIRILNKNFNRKKEVPEIPSLSENTKKVVLKFDKSVSGRVYDEFQHIQITEKENSLYVETNLPDNDKMYSYILSFANSVEVVEPLEIRLNVQTIIRNLSILYKI